MATGLHGIEVRVVKALGGPPLVLVVGCLGTSCWRMAGLGCEGFMAMEWASGSRACWGRVSHADGRGWASSPPHTGVWLLRG